MSRRVRHSSIAAVVLALAAASASAQDANLSTEQGRVALTVYSSNVALVQDARQVSLPKGPARVEFKDVSGAIRPETVSLNADGVSIAEQNFDFDLLTPAKLMEKAVGSEVKIVRVLPDGREVTETATVMSVTEGVVLKIGDRIEVLRDDGVPTRVIFDSIPENLRARPTLSVSLQSARAGPRTATLSYLTTGLNWKADYVALYDEKAGTIDLQGWVTLTNQSGVTYRDADVQLVAGNAQLTASAEEWWSRHARTRGGGTTAGMGGGGTGTAETLGDLYLYRLPARVTVAQNQTKQVGFVDFTGVKAEKAYGYQATGFGSDAEPAHAQVIYRFANSAEGGAATPLPGGVVRFYMRDKAGQRKFIGENYIDHTPVGSHLSVGTGEAFDVTVQATLADVQKIDDRRTRWKMSYRFRNARPEPVTVEFTQGGVPRLDPKFTAESLPGRKADASSRVWNVVVPANGEAVLTFTLEGGW